jgi:hypothetical protein
LGRDRLSRISETVRDGFDGTNRPLVTIFPVASSTRLFGQAFGLDVA